MRSKPFFALLVASLFAALTFTAVGLGLGEGVEGRLAFAQFPRAVAADSSVSDPEGDVLELRTLSPFPHPGRDLTIAGNTAKVLVPRWVVGDPQSFQWLGATLDTLEQVPLDVAPDYQVLNWTRGAVSEGPDAQNPTLLPHEDLTYVRLREVASSRLEFFWRCRGDIPTSPVDMAYAAFLGANLLDGPEYAVALAATDAGWLWSVSVPGDSRFSWDSRPYEDIVSAAVSQTGDGQLTFGMTTAQDIPAVPPEEDGYPWFVWMLDVDRDEATGGLNDLNVVARWNPESSTWQGALQGWSEEHYGDLQATVAVTRTGSTVSATVDVEDLGVAGSFLWQVGTLVHVGSGEEQFAGLADFAPDSGWAEEVLTPTPTLTPTTTATATPTATAPGPRRIYLPTIRKAVQL
jgi:hypothetical protein